MSGKNVLRVVFIVLAIVAVTAATLPTSADGSAILRTRGTGFETSQPQPEWNHIVIRDCAYGLAGDPDFNMHFACICLAIGAETQGEEVSARAQCKLALSHYCV